MALMRRWTCLLLTAGMLVHIGLMVVGGVQSHGWRGEKNSPNTLSALDRDLAVICHGGVGDPGKPHRGTDNDDPENGSRASGDCLLCPFSAVAILGASFPEQIQLRWQLASGIPPVEFVTAELRVWWQPPGQGPPTII